MSYVLLAWTVALSTFSMLGLGQAEASDKFSDVSNDHWASKEIDYVAEEGVATGDETGVFRPDEDVKRSQASVMMTQALRADGLDRSSPTFSDVERGYWAYTRIERAAEMGIFQGKNGKFHPGESIEKAQVAAIVARAFFGQESENYNGNVSFDDISDDFWAKGYIATLVDNNIIEDGGSFKPNASATRAELSAYLARAMNEGLRISNTEEKEILYEGRVNASTPLNVREGPGMEYNVFDTLANGTLVDVYGIEGNWREVVVNGKTGYVYYSYIETTDGVQSDEGGSSPEKAEPIAEATVTASTLLVRSGPSASYDKAGSLSRGERVDIYEQTNGTWVLIKYKGEWAYTDSSHLKELGLEGRTIVVDAGHGDHDPGAVGNGLVEKVVNLEVALRVEKLLKDAGVNVVMTRRDDTFISLSGRVDIAEKAKADSFVSIHANAASPSAEGAETFYNSDYQKRESKKLAELIQDRLVKETGMRYRRVADARFYVIRNTTMPSTLVELGFLTNSGDAGRMKKSGYYDKAAKAVFNGIKDYYES